MGYTHYWTQLRNFTTDEWRDAHEHIGAILKYGSDVHGVSLADGGGKPATRPQFSPNAIAFNGVGDDSHETFRITRRREKSWGGASLGHDSCKTARKPYDIIVKACLSYLSTVVENYEVSSDGNGAEWLDAVELARAALPRFANVLDIPRCIMQEDRWQMPWVGGHRPIPYAVRFCIDGRGYVIKRKSDESYCFETHLALAQFLRSTQRVEFSRGGNNGMGKWGAYGRVEDNIWRASGSFDTARHDRIAKAQIKALAPLFPVDPSCARQPPAFARPNQMPSPETPRYYYLEELLAAAETTNA